MIDKLFNSNGNKNAIKSIINDKIITSNNTNIKNEFDNLIFETMNYVQSQVSSVLPNGMKTEEYLYLMNKKVFDIVSPIIIKKIDNNKIKEKEIQKNILVSNKNQNNLQNNLQNNSLSNSKKKESIPNSSDTIFDSLLLKNYETPAIIDYPKPSSNLKKDENIENKITNLENERNVLTPKIRPIDFSIKQDENPVNTVQLYNDLLGNYNQQVNDMTNFEISQKNINNKVEKLENNEIKQNNSYSTPIDILLMNQSQINEINDININTAYNRTDIETFIPSEINSHKERMIPNQNIKDNYSYSSVNNDDLNNNYNNDIHTRNITQNYNQEFSSVNNKNSNILFKEPTFKIVHKKFYIIFDSSDRDLYEYPNPTSFQVKFSPTGNNFIFQNYYDNYNTLILSEKNIVYGDASKLSVQETFDNINNISCKSVNVPTNTIYIGSNDPQTTITGTPLNIFKESYLYLVIPELRGPYRGGNLLAYNSFAKLLVNYGDNNNSNTLIVNSDFTTLNTADNHEYFLYDPVSAGKIDKLTLNLVNKNGLQYNFGIDKLYVQGFSQGNLRYNGYCGPQYLTTIFTIQNINDEYIKYCKLYNKFGNCNLLNSHSITNGDLLYFYDTRPTFDQIAFLENNIYISKLKYDKVNMLLTIYVSYSKNIDGKIKNIPVNFKYIIPGANNNDIFLFKDYYIVIFDSKTNKNYYLKIASFTDNSINVIYNNSLPSFSNYKSIKIGIAKSNLRGTNSEEGESLFNKNGYNVISVGNTIDNMWNIEIDFPYNNLPDYLVNNIYNPGEIFLIQEKMQISYTFTVTINTKDYETLQSGLNESGNN
jgi:hypothetical protein